jgi:hypothetical protein
MAKINLTKKFHFKPSLLSSLVQFGHFGQEAAAVFLVMCDPSMNDL